MLSFRGLHLTSIGPDFIRQLQDGGIDPSAVISLTVADNELTSPVGLNIFGCLTHLDLSFNNISIIRGIPVTVTHLNLSHNKLEQIFGLDALSSLYEIDLSHNKLKDMTGLFYNIELRTVKMANNKIPCVSSLESLKNMESLDLSNNKIQSLDGLRCLSLNTYLKSLWLVGNPVAKLQGYKVTCRNLLPGLYTLDAKKLGNTSKDINNEILPKSTNTHTYQRVPGERVAGRKSYSTSLICRGSPEPGGFQVAISHIQPPPSNPRYELSPPPPPPMHPAEHFHTHQTPPKYNNTHYEDPYDLKSILPPNLVSILPPPQLYSTSPQNVFLVRQTTPPHQSNQLNNGIPGSYPSSPPSNEDHQTRFQTNSHQQLNTNSPNIQLHWIHNFKHPRQNDDNGEASADAANLYEQHFDLNGTNRTNETNNEYIESGDPKPIFRSYQSRSRESSFKSSTPLRSNSDAALPKRPSSASSHTSSPPSSLKKPLHSPKSPKEPKPLQSPKETKVTHLKETKPSLSPKPTRSAHGSSTPPPPPPPLLVPPVSPAPLVPPLHHLARDGSNHVSRDGSNHIPQSGSSARPLSHNSPVSHDGPLVSPNHSEASNESFSSARLSVDRESQTRNNSRSNSARALLASVVEQKKQLMHNMELYRKQFPKSEIRTITEEISQNESEPNNFVKHNNKLY